MAIYKNHDFYSPNQILLRALFPTQRLVRAIVRNILMECTVNRLAEDDRSGPAEIFSVKKTGSVLNSLMS